MEHETVNKLISENMKTVLGFSLSRLQNQQEAEELASDILYKLLLSAKNLRDDSKFFAYMWRVSENTYAEYLRGKIKHSHGELPDDITDENTSVEDGIILREEMHVLRRELSLLSEQYRRCTVLYYMEGLTCSQISNSLQISTEMVKYYLFRARKIIREGMSMNRAYGEKSYNPVNFEIDFWGTKAGDDNEYRDFQRRKIKGNILLAAYYSPVSVQELSIELGVAVPYLEDEIKILEKRQYISCKGRKYLTNIPIFTVECKEEIKKRTETLIKEAAEKIKSISDNKFSKRFSNRFSDDNLLRWQTVMLYSHFSMITVDKESSSEYGDYPSDGPYSLINGGGGKGYIWGRCVKDREEHGIEGIYNGCQAHDGRGTVIAFNFRQIVASQHFETNMIDLISCTGVGCYAALPDNCKPWLHDLGYEVDGKPNFAVYTDEEYEEMSQLLENGIEIFTDLFRKAGKTTAEITAEHAPEHIREYAKRVGILVYQFEGLAGIIDNLYQSGWLFDTEKTAKPAMCLIKHSGQSNK